jgi:hypothetical protein
VIGWGSQEQGECNSYGYVDAGAHQYAWALVWLRRVFRFG